MPDNTNEVRITFPPMHPEVADRVVELLAADGWTNIAAELREALAQQDALDPESPSAPRLAESVWTLERAVQFLHSKQPCVNYGEATEDCDCLICRTQTVLTEWEDDPHFKPAALAQQDQESSGVGEAAIRAQLESVESDLAGMLDGRADAGTHNAYLHAVGLVRGALKSVATPEPQQEEGGCSHCKEVEVEAAQMEEATIDRWVSRLEEFERLIREKVRERMAGSERSSSALLADVDEAVTEARNAVTATDFPATGQEEDGGAGALRLGDGIRTFERLSELVTAAAPIESGEGGEEDRERFAEAFQDACFHLAELEREYGLKPPATSPSEQGGSGLVIDAAEFAEARRDPKVKALLDRAEQYGRELAEREQGGEVAK